MARLDERSLRSERWEEGHPVELADGQTWHLPRPRVRFIPHPGPNGFRARLALGDNYQDLLDALEAAEGSQQVIASELALGRALLGHNYDLTDEQVGELLQYSWDPADAEGDRIRRQTLDCALGIGPKLPAAGDE